MEQKTKETKLKFKDLLNKYKISFPKVGEIVKGRVIDIGRNEIKVDIGGIALGTVRGPELYDESGEYTNLKIGDKVEAMVIEPENEKGEIELSFQVAGHQKAWEKLHKIKKKGEIIEVKIFDANKGGLMAKFKNLVGFIPVSQLSPEHYPRVPGGDKERILEKLKKFVGKNLRVKIIDLEEKERKLIFSEKIAWEEDQKNVLDKYKVGNIVEGEITAVTDFGAFVKFGENLEGLIHISEIAWQRIEDPKDFLKVGQKVKAEIINIENSKIYLSIKKLAADPWKDIEKKYKIGQIVKGKVLKVNPFGLFVEITPEIHGLAHISELSSKPIKDIYKFAKAGDVFKFKIVSLEPEEHRLGLSLRALEKKKK